METLLSFASFGFLRTFLNIILIGVVIYFVANKYSYIVNVVAYAIAETFIPRIIDLFLSGFTGASVSFSFGTILVSLILFFLLGLLVIKITQKITDHFSSDTIFYFIIAFGIVDFLVTISVVFLLRLLLVILL